MKNVKTTITVASRPERVFDAWINFDDLHAWWTVEKSHVDTWQNGAYCLAWFVTESGIKYINQGSIEIWSPGNRLKIKDWCWLSPERPFLCGMTLDISLELLGTDSTFLSVTQSGYREEGDDWNWYFNAVTDAWPRVLHQLKSFLEKS